jgi:hypothetical protein
VARRIIWLCATLGLVLLVGCGGTPTPVAPTSPNYILYQHPDVEATFRYPDFLTPTTDIQKERSDDGLVLRANTVTLSSSKPVVIMSVRILTDPILTQDNWYPPSDILLQLYAITNLTELKAREDVAGSIIAAAKSGTRTSISGFPGLVFQYAASSSPYGSVYLQGGVVITPDHLVELFVIGSDERGVKNSVSRDTVNRIWKELETSFLLQD